MAKEQKSHISVLLDIRGKVLICGIKKHWKWGQKIRHKIRMLAVLY